MIVHVRGGGMIPYIQLLCPAQHAHVILIGLSPAELGRATAELEGAIGNVGGSGLDGGIVLELVLIHWDSEGESRCTEDGDEHAMGELKALRVGRRAMELATAERRFLGGGGGLQRDGRVGQVTTMMDGQRREEMGERDAAQRKTKRGGERR